MMRDTRGKSSCTPYMAYKNDCMVVLNPNPNEYEFVLDKTKGLLSCVVGSFKMSLSTSDALVRFDEGTKKFHEVSSFSDAIMTFVSAPENWYMELKNPVKDESKKYPTPGTSNVLPEFHVGKKINIRGNVSFALYPDMPEGPDMYKFNAIDLSDISGIYVKVVSDYTDKGISHKTGEELFITGKEQRIYYPRPEHAIIDYDGQIVHHAIAVPKGEGRYILNRMTGNIKLVKGPSMYLPDPRTEVVVKRKLSEKECMLWYPGNHEALDYNASIGEQEADEERGNGLMHEKKYSRVSSQGFSRKNQYTEPRTITIDNKYNGAVSVNVWIGYAVNVVSKGGQRKVVTGPTTYLMEYDETLEPITLSTGKPKTTDRMIETVYLRVDNNKISDIINVQTKDFVKVSVKVSYCIDFLPSHKDRWFNVENYVKYVTDRERSILKMEAKKFTIGLFYENTTEIVRSCLLAPTAERKEKGMFFEENGMLVKDVEVLSVTIEEDIREIMDKHQYEIVAKELSLANAKKSIDVSKELAEAEKEKLRIDKEREQCEIEKNLAVQKLKIEAASAIDRLTEAAETATKTAQLQLQEMLNSLQDEELAREKKASDANIARRKEGDALKMATQKAGADNIKKVMDSIGPDLIVALTSSANADILGKVTTAMGPYAIAENTSVAEVTDKLLRGTPLEGLLNTLTKVTSDTEE